MTIRPDEIREDDFPVIDMPPAKSSEGKAVPVNDRVREISYGLLLALLMGGCLAFGTADVWPQFVFRTGALVLFGFWVSLQYQQESIQLFPKTLSLPVLAFGCVVLWQLLSGSTAYRYATLTESLNLVVYGIVILVAGELFDRRRTFRAFVVAMSVFGGLLSLFSVIQGMSGTNKLYGIWPVEAVSAAIYGPYVNHNHYAGLMEMLIPLAAAVAFLEQGSKRVLVLFMTAVMVLSVVLSRSRGGMIAIAVQLVFVCIVLFRRQKTLRGMATALGSIAMIVVFVFALGSDKMLERFSEAQDAYRLKIYRDTLRMAAQKPILGYGLGTFSTVYPAHRSFYTNLLVNHAHNDYLELLAETGIVGLGLFLWFVAGVCRSGWKKIADRNDEQGRTLTLAALTGVIGILVHSLVDFNLHIPANAALFFVLCAAIATPFKHVIRPPEFRAWPIEYEELADEAGL